MTNRANPRLKKAAALAALTLALSLPASGILAASTFEAHYTTASVTAQEQIAGNLLNLDRSNYNLAELTIDPALSRIARLKSEDMRDNRYFAHVSPTYGDVRDISPSWAMRIPPPGRTSPIIRPSKRRRQR